MKIKTILTFSLLNFTYVFATLTRKILTFEPNCISFTVSKGTGCDWMCNYCSSMVGSNNYYFDPPICTYQSGGCVGNPQAGVMYSCCKAD